MVFLSRIKETIKKYRLIEKGDSVVVGVSGGPDSVALLFALNSLKNELKFDLHIAHFDHKLRKDSRKDREFVEGLARRLSLPLSVTEINIKALAKNGSLEEIARNARLGFFFSVARNIKAGKIALGHNLDDQAETVLMRILRGSGLYGLSGILPKRKIADYQVIRPLIEVKRNLIEQYLKKLGIHPRIDQSNKKDIFFRNKIRNRLMPLLKKDYNCKIKEILSNLAESAGSDYEYLSIIARKKISRLNGKINIAKFIKLHPAMRRLVLRLSIERKKGNLRQIDFRHIKEIEDLIINRPVNSVVDLPGEVSVKKKKATIVFFSRK